MSQDSLPAIGISYTATLGQAAQLVLQTHVAQDDPDALAKMLVTFTQAGRVAQARSELPDMRRRAENDEKMLDRALKDIERLDGENASSDNGRRNPRLSNAQKVDREKANISVERWKTDLKNLRDAIADHEKLIGD